jgi:hypothetical protein
MGEIARLEDIDRLRCRLFGGAAVTLAAVRLGPLGTARAHANTGTGVALYRWLANPVQFADAGLGLRT